MIFFGLQDITFLLYKLTLTNHHASLRYISCTIKNLYCWSFFTVKKDQSNCIDYIRHTMFYELCLLYCIEVVTLCDSFFYVFINCTERCTDVSLTSVIF